MNNIEARILNYATSHSRNKIIFHREEIQGILSLDVGIQLSETIYNMQDMEKLPMRVSHALDQLFKKSILQHEKFGMYVAIKNMGILFEPELKINFSQLFDANSQNNLLFIQWEGEKEGNNLFFLSKENGLKINISNLSHITI